MSTLPVVQDEKHQRLEVKLRRELGDQVLRLLDDNLTEDILLNPDGSLWVKRTGHCFCRIGEMPAAQAASALGTIAALAGNRIESRTPDPRNGASYRRQPLRRHRLAGCPTAGVRESPPSPQDLQS
jgi:Flp pilus assembly CpaF family ATPase